VVAVREAKLAELCSDCLGLNNYKGPQLLSIEPNAREERDMAIGSSDFVRRVSRLRGYYSLDFRLSSLKQKEG